MLVPLFAAELVYRSEMEPLTRNGDGELIGSGDGSVAGDSNQRRPRVDGVRAARQLSCAMNPVAVIETEEGARVRLEARGFARRSDEASRIWDVTATLRFESDDERYRWLDNAPGVWESEFDGEAHRAHYQAYLVRDAANGPQR